MAEHEVRTAAGRRASRSCCCVPRRRGRLRPGAGALRRRPRGRRRARSSPCSAPTAPASRRCCKAISGTGRPDRRRHLLRRPRHHPRRRRADAPSSASSRCPAARRCSRRSPSPSTSGPPAWLYRDDPEHLAGGAPRRCSRSFPRLRERCDQMAGNLSGGEQQMLALGMAFIAKPKLLMIDELSLGLAPTIVEQLLDIVRAHPRPGHARSSSSSSRSTSPSPSPSAPTSWRRARCASQGPTAELLERDDILRSVFLEGAGRRRRQGASARRRPGRGDAATRPAPTEPAPCSRSTGSTQALRRHPRRRRRHASTLRRGRDPRPHRPQRRRQDDDLRPHLRVPRRPTAAASCSTASTSPTWRPTAGPGSGLGRSFQDARLFPSLTVAENLAIGLERHLEVRDHLAVAARPARRRAARRRTWRWTVDDLDRADEPRRVPRQVRRASCRPARAASSTWPCASPTTRRCCCSTSRRRASPSGRPRRSARCSSASSARPAAPCSSSSTTCR